MDLKNQGNEPNSSPNPNIPFKKKRGRPRKDQTQNLSRIANLLTMRDQIHGHGNYAQAPPGFARVNENHSHQENPVQHNDNAMVGQTVSGVIEATFDAGYFLSVRIGNSETSLRGVVFKPGHYLPVSGGNDLIPHIQMISRNVGPTPVLGSYNRSRGKGRGKPRKDSRLTHSEKESSAGNQLVTLLGERGNLVPVVLEPANLSNGVAPTIETPPVVSQPAHLAASKGKSVNQIQLKQLEKDLEKDNHPPAFKLPDAVMEDLMPVVLESANMSNGVATTIETPPAISQPAHLAASKGKSVNQTQLKQLEKDVEKYNRPPALKLPVAVMEDLVPVVLESANMSNAVAPTIETPPAVSQPAHLAVSKGKSVNQTQLKRLEKDLEKDSGHPALKLPVDVMEDLVSDAFKKIEGSSRSKKTQNESGKPSSANANKQMQDLNEPFLVNPLQAIFSDPFNQFSAVHQNFRDARPPGKMTELLLGNVIRKQASDVQHHGFGQHLTFNRL